MDNKERDGIIPWPWPVVIPQRRLLPEEKKYIERGLDALFENLRKRISDNGNHSQPEVKERGERK